MASNDNWFNRNAGFIELMGHLAAIRQRSELIQQGQQANFLLHQQVSLEQQQANAESERTNRKNILYEVNQTAQFILAHYLSTPEIAYYESLLLEQQVKEMGINHTWFDELDWKDYCNKTVAYVSDLVSEAFKYLKPERCASVENKIRDEIEEVAHKKRIESEKIAQQLAIEQAKVRAVDTRSGIQFHGCPVNGLMGFC